MKNKSGITLIELLIVMVIFSVVIAGLYSAYQVQVRQGVKEFRQSQTSIELSIASNMIERDLMMAGYGIAEDYSEAPVFAGITRPASATNGAPDTLTLMGTAIGMASRAAQGWTYLANFAPPGVPNFMQWGDMREEVSQNDIVTIMEPSSKQLLVNAVTNEFLFRFNAPNLDLTSVPGNNLFPFNPLQAGTVLFGFYANALPPIATLPYYTVTYTRGGVPLSNCEPGTQSLLRAESRTLGAAGAAQPLINCVLDFQVAFGLDWTESGSITTWDNGGVLAATLGGTTAITVLNRRLKQIRAYVLVQEGNRDPNYTYSNPDTLMAADVIRVGELGLPGGATGRDITLTAAQRQYRWKMLTFAVTPRNI